MTNALILQQMQQAEPLGLETTSNIVNYKNERDRYNTFFTWTKPYIDTQKLALYGFYLCRSPDIVECAFCRVQIGDWELGDNVLREHVRWSPNCPLLCRLITDNIPIDPISFDAAIPKKRLLNVQLITSSVESEPEFSPLSTGHTEDIKCPDFRMISNRLASFKEWPKAMAQTPKILSDAGFFYCGKGDSVKCFSCGGGLRDWEHDDDPWEQHALHYENCNYVNAMKSPQFISATKQKLEHSLNAVLQNENESMMATSEEGPNDLKLCQICFDEERCAIFLPCMHVLGCIKCSYSCEMCPICRTNVTSVKRIYFS